MAYEVYNAYQSEFTGHQIDAAVNFVHTQVAEPFDFHKAYVVDDLVVYDGFLYQCRTATTAGAP